MSTPQETFDQIESNVKENPGKIANLAGVIQFDLSGDNGGQWYVLLGEGGGIHTGASDSANTTITMAASDFVDMTQGKLDATMAFMSGKLKVKGDMGLAMKLQTILR